MTTYYKNDLSRILFKKSFENQWVIPRKPPAVTRVFFALYEKLFVRPDCSKQSVDRPIFIISQPRSGSSMLQDLMSAHSEVAFINNMMHIFSPYFCGAEIFRRQLDLDIEGERFLNDSVMVNGSTPADPVAVWNRWLNLDPAELSFHELTAAELGPERVQQISTEICKILWCHKPYGGGRFLSKNPGLLPYIKLLNELFPDARFIYLIRDPRQNANSMLKLYRLCEKQRQTLSWDEPELIAYPRLPRLKEYIDAYGPDNLETTARLWRDAAQFMMPWESASNVYSVRYEDILTNPIDTMNSILEFCDLSPEGADNPSYLKRLNSIGKTHHKNTNYDGFKRIEELCKDEMKRLNYL